MSGVRLDSGDLGELAAAARRILDEAGLQTVTIFASGGLEEDAVARLVASGAPIDGFGVGTDMGVSRDVPSLDIAYKLVEYAGRPRTKLSTGKRLPPGRKQVFRMEREGRAVHDVLAGRDESSVGRPLLRQVMAGGARTADGRVTLDEARAHARRELGRLPPELRRLTAPASPYHVELSARLIQDAELLRRLHESGR